MNISIIHPSRNRPQKARACYDYWTKRASQKVQWILSLDEDDKFLNSYYAYFNDAIKRGDIQFVIKHNRSITEAVNSGAKESIGNLFIIVSDDFICMNNWDADLLKYLEGKEDFVGRVYDGNQRWIVTLPMMDRAYYEGKGYMYNPEYLHMFADTEMTACAEMEGKIIEIPMTFEHLHPMYGKAKPDGINKRANDTWEQGKKLYLQRVKDKFGIVEIKGEISDAGHLKFIEENA